MSSSTPSTPGGYGTLTGPPPMTTTTNDEVLFQQVYNHAKLNENWSKLSSALKAHPDWATRIPENRRWTILHQIVFSGNRDHLDEALAYQMNNPDFRLLFKAADGKTVRDVAVERQHIHPNMIRHIERLIFCDQLLNNVKETKWEVVKSSLRQKPDWANEKPPYRRRYLVHQLASRGLLNEFKEINEIARLRLDLLSEGKTPSQLARSTGHEEFANYIDRLVPPAATGGGGAAAAGGGSGGSHSSSTGSSGHPPGQPKYSPGFYDDVSISIMPAGVGGGYSLSNPHVSSYHYPAALTHDLLLNGYGMNDGGYGNSHSGSGYGGGGGASGVSYHGSSAKTSVKKKPVVSTISEDEQTKYEHTVTDNADRVTGTQLLDSMTCSITKQILRDPVVAADGYTYEREAITKWFENSTRSPMTNQELDTTDLKPNYAIKSILNSLHSGAAAPPGAKPKGKDPSKK